MFNRIKQEVVEIQYCLCDVKEVRRLEAEIEGMVTKEHVPICADFIKQNLNEGMQYVSVLKKLREAIINGSDIFVEDENG